MSKSNETIKCEKCSNITRAIKILCLCDLDFCQGQRCGASDIIHYYECSKCGWKSKITDEAERYFKRYEIT